MRRPDNWADCICLELQQIDKRGFIDTNGFEYYQLRSIMNQIVARGLREGKGEKGRVSDGQVRPVIEEIKPDNRLHMKLINGVVHVALVTPPESRKNTKDIRRRTLTEMENNA